MQKSLLVTCFSCCFLISCSTTSTKHSKAQVEKIQMCKAQLPAAKKIKTQSVSMGCIGSLVFNKMISSNNPAPLLCMAGGASGFLFGESITERKCAYLTLEEQLDGEIAHASKINAGFEIIFAQQATQLAALKLQSAGLSTQTAKDEESLARITSLKQDIDQQLTEDKEFITLVKNEFRFKQETLKKSKSLEQDDKEEKLLSEIKALQKSILTLQKNSYQLAKIKAELDSPPV